MILFYSVKKDRLIWGVVGLFGLVAIFCCGVFNEKQMAKEALAVPIANQVVVIDPGHGGFDAGALANGIEEKEINLAVSCYLKGYIEQGGGIAVLTRAEDVSTAEENTRGVSAKKSDLTARKKLAETAGADVFVSIHMNKFPQTQYKGAQVFYSESGKRLGEEIQASLKEVIADGNERQAKKTDGSIFILKDTSVPSVIVECGFLSNPQDAELLMQDAYRQKLAWGIYLGLVRYFNG